MKLLRVILNVLILSKLVSFFIVTCLRITGAKYLPYQIEYLIYQKNLTGNGHCECISRASCIYYMYVYIIVCFIKKHTAVCVTVGSGILFCIQGCAVQNFDRVM